MDQKRARAHPHTQEISFDDDKILIINLSVSFMPIKAQQERKSSVPNQTTAAMSYWGDSYYRAKRLCHLPNPCSSENGGKKEASLVDKSSFSSWLHTAAGGLTCHRRIQPLIHLCFPQVFLNFTQMGRSITASEPGFPCQPSRRVHGLSSPRQIC